jgi:hypothetical protein
MSLAVRYFLMTNEAVIYRMIKDERVKGEQERSIFNVKDAGDKLG